MCSSSRSRRKWLVTSFSYKELHEQLEKYGTAGVFYHVNGGGQVLTSVDFLLVSPLILGDDDDNHNNDNNNESLTVHYVASN